VATVVTNVELRPPSEPEPQLLQVSKYLQFVGSVKEVFLEEFENYKQDFPDVDAIRFFTGCVVQPLSWHQTNKIFNDPLCISGVDADYLLVMRSIVQLMRSGFTDSVYGCHKLFKHRFKDCSHPFFKKVYLHAKKVDNEMADCLHICSI